MGTPTATQPAPLSLQIAALQAFVAASGIVHEPGQEVQLREDVTLDAEQLGRAWGRLRDTVVREIVQAGTDNRVAFSLAQQRIGSRLESLEQDEVSRAVLDREGIDPFELEQHAEKGLLLLNSVRAFNFAAAQYLQKRLDDAGIKLGDFILSAAWAYYSGAAGPFEGLAVSANSFYKAFESETDVTIVVQNVNEPPKIHLKYPGSSSSVEVSQYNFFERSLVPWCEKALRILVAGNTQLQHKNFFELPVLVRSDIGYLQALYRTGLMDAHVIGAFLTKLNIIKKRPDGLAIL